jgi:hypothetical protein
MIIGVLLMIVGVVLPLLMVIRVIESTFLLAFVSYGASLVGMVLAFLGLFSYIAGRRKDR